MPSNHCLAKKILQRREIIVTSPTVFISYTQENAQHVEAVYSLASQLTIDGIKVAFDQYEATFSDSLELWMERNIADSDFVILICTQTYMDRVSKEEEEGKGLGAKWEGHLIRQHLYREGASNRRFIPVLFPGSTPDHIPRPFGKSFPYYQVDPSDLQLGNGSGYEKLYRRLTDQHGTPAPELGVIRRLPIRQPPTSTPKDGET